VAKSNRQWILASYPEGMPEESNWELREEAPREPGDEEVLVRAIYLSVDPYMRGRISPNKNYAAGVELGRVMAGGGVGEVMTSKHPSFRPGDIVESMGFGWQEFPVVKGRHLRRVDPSVAPIQSALSYLGMPGLTAYFAMREIGKPQPGETVLVSAASGAVGQVVGQIAKINGCRAVAVASSDAKLAWCREIGYDAGVNYRSAADLPAAVAEACPDGVHVYFDNTGGPIHDAAMENLALKARIIICGMVSLADRFGQPDIGVRHLRQMLVNRARMEGFLVSDHYDRYVEGIEQLAQWHRDGKLKFREDVMDGIENMPKAFLRLLHSENFGKQLVKISDPPA
jgi:NADPH-dependent curcumin reductase CurA